MKKISIWYSAAILVVLIVFATEIGVAQNRTLESLGLDKARLDKVFQRQTGNQGTQLVTNDDVIIQPLIMLQEPAFTSGFSNMLFWQVPEEPITFTYQGEVVNVSIDSCFAVIYALANGKQIEQIVEPVSNGNKLITFDSVDDVGTEITYSCFLGILYDSGGRRDLNAETIVSSYQDIVGPTVGSLQVEGPGKNGWLTTNDVTIKYFDLQDVAGIFSVKLSGDINIADSSFYNFDPFDPQPTQIDTGEFNINLADGGPYFFEFSACDAAYDSLMPPLNPNAPWILNSNCAKDVLSGQIKIDTQPPEIILAGVPSVLNPKYPGYNAQNKTLSITFPIYDGLSHVDAGTVNPNTVTFDPMIPFNYGVSKAYNPAKDTCYVTITISSITQLDVISTLKVSVADSAGNPASDQKELRFNFKPSEITKFFMVDPNYEDEACLVPDSLHANESQMLFDSLETTDNDIEKIHFYVKIDGVQVGNDTVAYPKEKRIIFDPLQLLGLEMPADGVIMAVTLSAIDVDGNEQSPATRATRSVTFDRTPPTISVSAADTSSWEDGLPGRYGAFEGWTNEPTVRVTIESPDDDLYKLEETSPEKVCTKNPKNTFLRTLSAQLDGEKIFTYQAGDFAGNKSNIDTDSIQFDTKPLELDTSHVKVFDPVTFSELSTASINIKIAFNEQNLPADHGISRIVVNDELFYMLADDTLTVPVGDGIFEISVIDFAGNMSNEITEKIDVEPGFQFIMHDLTEDTTRISGWTNSARVGWKFLGYNFDLDKVDELLFYDKDTTNSDPKKVEDTKEIDLSKLYSPLESGAEYEVKGRVVLNNGAQTPGGKLFSAFIKFDNVEPRLETISLSDTSANPREAAPGFTNDGEVQLLSLVSDEHSGVDSIRIEGEGFQSLPKITPYEQNITLLLNSAPENATLTANVICAVRDLAGNWVSAQGEKQASILYLKQDIAAAPVLTTVPVAETETELVVLSLRVTCEFHQYLSYVHVTKPDGSTIKIYAENFETDGAGGTTRTYGIPLNDVDAGTYRFVFVDKAGSASGVSDIKVQILRKPEISVTLYDFSEFDENDMENSDSLYTDDNSVVQLVVRRKADSGLWNEIRFAFEGQAMPDTWEAVADTALVFMRAIPVDTLVDDCTITLRVQAQNEAFPSDTVRASIIFDSISPILGSFTVDRNGASDEWIVNCQPEDHDSCKSGVAGIVIKDETATTRTERWLYLQGSDRSISFTDPESGLHRLEAFAVDNADVNQNKVSAEFETLAKLAEYLTGSENGIDHPSETGQDSVWVLRNVTYNFPNPFNPEMEKTKIKVDRENVSSVDVRIFDLFGNLVYEAFNVSSTDGTSNLIVEWHGKNGNDEIVASGTYLAVITLDNGETLDPIKVGVLRKSGH